MSFTYTKNSSDFQNELSYRISTKQLKVDIMSNIDAPLFYINRAGESFVFVFGIELVEPELTKFNALIQNYQTLVFDNDVAIITSEKTIGTNAGSFIKDVWTTRELNTIKGVINFVSISSNQIILQPGTYELMCECPANEVKNHKCRLYDITNSLVVEYGTNAYSTVSNTFTKLYTMIDIGVPTTYEVQHICSETIELVGLGLATGYGLELYTIVRIQKIN